MVRQQAETADPGPERADLLDIADQYDRIADRLIGGDSGPVTSGAPAGERIQPRRVATRRNDDNRLY